MNSEYVGSIQINGEIARLNDFGIDAGAPASNPLVLPQHRFMTAPTRDLQQRSEVLFTCQYGDL